MSRARLLALWLLLASLSGSAQQLVGKVDRMVPAGFIARGASTTEAKPADLVEWNDILRTNDQGRMRIALEDGSQLSLGRKSELRVVKHDLQSNQTLVEMLYGRVRANVTPIRKTGGSFQVRTPTAVVGVLGTTLEVETMCGGSTCPDGGAGSAMCTGPSCTSGDTSPCTGPSCAAGSKPDLYANARPDVDAKRKPALDQTSRRSPVICSYETMTLALDRATQNPPRLGTFSDLEQLTPGLMPGGNDQAPTIADYPSVNVTIVHSLDHIVGVKNIDPRIPKMVFLLPGQCTIVVRGMPPTDPVFEQPQPSPPQNSTSNAAPAPCPEFVDPRRFDELFPEGKRPTYEITGRGTSTGQVFDVHIKNPSDCPLDVLIPAGTVLKPTGYTERLLKGILVDNGLPPLKDFQVMIAEGGHDFGDEYRIFSGIRLDFFVPPETGDVSFPLRGYCLELHKLAPHMKTKYKFADKDEQERLSAPNLKVIEAADRIFFTGQGPPPNLAGLDALAQWSLWASREGLTDSQRFQEQYVGLVKRNYEAQKKKFDKQTKEQVEGVAQAFWPYVQKVLEAAK